MTALYGTTAPLSDQRAALVGGDVPVAVYGLGKMGLPLAGVYAELTGSVIGVDIDDDVVASISRGDSPVQGEPGLDELVATQVDAGRLEATTDASAAAATARVHVIIVPTLLSNGAPDLSTVESVVSDVAAGLEPGDLVVAESTLPPGTCRHRIQPSLAAKSGLSTDEFGVAFCPERTASGHALRDIRGHYPKVVGGVDEESSRAAAVIYDLLSDNEVHVVSDATTAEAVKVFEGVYRDVNIALANELARFDGRATFSVREAIATANGLPMCHIHDPGPGVGGHCIPVYPHFLLSQSRSSMPLTRTSRAVNESMPAATVDLLEDSLGHLDGARVAVLGIAYRPGVAELRYSPGLAVVATLEERGARPVAVDPVVDPATAGLPALSLAEFETAGLDAVILVTPHEAFRSIDWSSIEPLVVVDGRDALSIEGDRHEVVTLGDTARGGPSVVDDALLESAPSPLPDGGE